MSFSKSRKTLRRILDRLAPLAQKRTWTFPVEPGREDWWAYKLREARTLLHRYPEEAPYLLPLIDSYEFKPQAGRVVAEWIGSRQMPEVGLAEPAAQKPTIVTGVESVEQVIQSWLLSAQANGANRPVVFSGQAIGADGLKRVARWAEFMNPALQVVRSSQTSFTIQLFDPTIPASMVVES